MNHPFEYEDRSWLASLAPIPRSFRGFGRPDEVLVDWHESENQGRMGSCQGNGLTSCIERTVYIATRKIVQLSRIYAYLRTQQVDGLLGSDRGSTITGGGKVALEGVPLESLTSYPSSYPGKGERNRILSFKESCDYKAVSVQACPDTADEALDLIGGGAAISFGIPWYPGVIPSDRIVRRFNPPSRAGGHAMAVLGYKRNGNLVPVNSHGDGPYEITPEAWEKMLRHPYTAAIVLLGSDAPDKDWSQERYL